MALGVVPTIQSRQPLDPAPVGPRVAPQEFGTGGRVVSALANVADEVTQRFVQARRVQDVTKAQTELLREFTDLERRFGEDTDWRTAPQRFEAEAKAIQERFRQQYGGDGETWRVVGADAERQAIRTGVMVQRLARGRQVEEGRATLTTSIDEAARVAAVDPTRRDEMFAKAEGSIEAARLAGFIGADDAVKMQTRFRGSVEQAQALRLITTNPGEAVRRLADPAQFENLDPVQRERLLSTATTRQDMLARRAEAQAAATERSVLVEAQQIDQALYAGFPMTDRLAALRARAKGTAAEPVVERLAADAAAVTELRALPVGQQVERLTAAEAKARAPNASPEDVAQFARLQRAFAGQQQAIDRRGLAQAVTDGLVEALPPINLADPASVAAHANAAQVASRHYGRPVSALTEDAAQELAQQFGRLPPDQRGQAVAAVMQIADPEVRAATIQHIERLRGDGGRMPAGSLARVAQIMQNGPEGAAVADRVMAALSVDVSDRVKQAGESAELRSAMESLASSGVQGVLAGQSSATLDPRYAATATRDLEAIQRIAAVFMASGETASRAVRRAAELWNYGYATVDARGEARVIFPATVASPAEVRTGLRVLRERAANEPLPGADAGADAAGVGRARRDALRAGEWINEGNRFSLVVTSGGRAIPLLSVTMDEVKAAATRQETQQPLRAAPATAAPNASGSLVRPVQRPEAPVMR
jgi:hypothetical protein